MKHLLACLSLVVALSSTAYAQNNTAGGGTAGGGFRVKEEKRKEESKSGGLFSGMKAKIAFRKIDRALPKVLADINSNISTQCHESGVNISDLKTLKAYLEKREMCETLDRTKDISPKTCEKPTALSCVFYEKTAGEFSELVKNKSFRDYLIDKKMSEGESLEMVNYLTAIAEKVGKK